MTKANLVARILRIYPYMSSSNTSQIIDILLDSVVDTLRTGGRVELRGFGTFGVKERGPRQRRNPKTGEAVLMGAHRVPFFKSGKQLKALVNNLEVFEKSELEDDERIISIDDIKDKAARLSGKRS